MAGIAGVVLGAFLLIIPIPGVWLPIAVLAGVSGAGCLVLWWRRKQARKYDLAALYSEPPAAEDEPFEDTVPDDTVGAPYCGWCDEPHAPGTYRCLRCGRALG